MNTTRLFTGLVKLIGLLIAVRFGLLEGIILGGKPDTQALLVAAFMMTGATGADSIIDRLGAKK